MKKCFVLVFSFMSFFAIGQRDCGKIILYMDETRNNILQQMSSSNDKKKNDALFDNFYETYSRNLLSFTEENMIQCGYLVNSEPTPVFKKILNKYGLELCYGEGDMYLDIDKKVLYNTFRNYLSDEYTMYFGIMQKPQNLFEDASIVAPWSDLGRLVYLETEFIRKYPRSKRINEVIESYSNHLYFFLIGVDNSPSEGNAEAQKAIKQFVSNYPNTIATKIVNHYLKERNRMTSEQLGRYIANEIRKQTGY